MISGIVNVIEARNEERERLTVITTESLSVFEGIRVPPVSVMGLNAVFDVIDEELRQN